MGKLILLVGGIIGFLIAYILSGKNEGQPGILRSLIFTLGNYTFHLHHWIIALVILITLLYSDLSNDFVQGLLVGMIVQGLTYHDFYKFVSKA